jgi:long-chain acyl-CoA synthetase
MSTLPETATPAGAHSRTDTLPHIFRARCRSAARRVALREKHLGIWRPYTWDDYYDRTRALGLGLSALGLRPGDRVAIHSEDRPEWVFSELGVICCGGTSVGIYPTNPSAEVSYILRHSEARFLIAEDQEQVDKTLEVADELPGLERIIVIDPKGLRHYDDPRLTTYAEVEALGREQDPAAFERAIDDRSPDEIAMIVYTSGTTGPPKGAMLSQTNLAHAIRMSTSITPGRPDDRLLSYLPLCHVAEKILTLYIPLSSGASANFAESIETVPENIREVEPTIFLGVPRIWEKMVAGINIRMQDATPLKRANFRLWMRVGNSLGKAWLRAGGRYRFGWRLSYAVGWLCLYRAVQRKLGLAKCHTAVSGAAPIAPEVLHFFHGIGIHIREGWAQTESSGIGTFTPPDDIRVGTVGKPLEGVELRIEESTSEILLRGPFVFAGYFRDPEATAATIDTDGWLHTGDVGYVDEDGHLHITDRMKDIIITAGGKNISPSEIENKLKFSSFIREAVVVGDRRKFLSALIGIELDAVGDWATRRGISFTTYHDLTQKPEIVELIGEEIRKANRDLAGVEQIKAFRLIPKELDHTDGELTATQKVKRRVMEDRFHELVDAIYSAGAS